MKLIKSPPWKRGLAEGVASDLLRRTSRGAWAARTFPAPEPTAPRPQAGLPSSGAHSTQTPGQGFPPPQMEHPDPQAGLPSSGAHSTQAQGRGLWTPGLGAASGPRPPPHPRTGPAALGPALPGLHSEDLEGLCRDTGAAPGPLQGRGPPGQAPSMWAGIQYAPTGSGSPGCQGGQLAEPFTSRAA